MSQLYYKGENRSYYGMGPYSANSTILMEALDINPSV